MHLIQQTRDVSHRIYLCGIKTRPVKVLAAMNSPDYQLPLPGLTLQIQGWLVLNEICSSINSTILQYPVHSRSLKTFVKMFCFWYLLPKYIDIELDPLNKSFQKVLI